MRRFFSRSSPSELAAPDLSRDCAHGCPACPHPGAFFEFDDEGASTLLPADRLLLDGGTLELHSAAVDDAGDFAIEEAQDFDFY